jgi:pyruvate kinase
MPLVIPLILTYRYSLTVTRDDVTARQCHLSRGVYPVHYPEPRGIPTAQWQIDVDNRIR